MASEGQLEDGTKEERLKKALWYHIGKMTDSIAIEQNLNTTPLFIGSLSEMLWAQIGATNECSAYVMTDHDLEAISRDAEAFARHAGRDTIRVQDILLLARRNESLHKILKKSADELKRKDEWHLDKQSIPRAMGGRVGSAFGELFSGTVAPSGKPVVIITASLLVWKAKIHLQVMVSTQS